MMGYRDVAATGDVAPGNGTRVVVDGRAIAIFNVNGQFYATDDECTHAAASLSEGEVCDGEVTCRRHGAIFDVRTGEAIGTPAEKDLTIHRVRVVGDRIEVALASED